MKNYKNPVIMLDGHGDDLHLSNHPIKYNFSSNVYYRGCPAPLLHALQKKIVFIENYPSPSASELNFFAQTRYGISHDYFLFTNGATEAFYLLAQHFRGKSAAILTPTFAEYEDACNSFDIEVVKIKKEELSICPAVDLVFVCNPNNPDGSCISSQVLYKIILEHPKSTFVIDEAYIEFTDTTESLIGKVLSLKNLVIVRSLTKTFTIPGLRLGYMVAHPSLIASILSFKMPWTVNVLAVEIGRFIFENYEELTFDKKELLAKTKRFQMQLKEIEGITVMETNTSYFLIELHEGTAEELKKTLIQKYQILVRDATNFNISEGKEYIRVATQSEKANQALIKALKKWR